MTARKIDAAETVKANPFDLADALRRSIVVEPEHEQSCTRPATRAREEAHVPAEADAPAEAHVQAPVDAGDAPPANTLAPPPAAPPPLAPPTAAPPTATLRMTPFKTTASVGVVAGIVLFALGAIAAAAAVIFSRVLP
jgi:hypothetical protein